MTNQTSTARANASDKSKAPRKDGDSVQRAREWGGGSKGSKGPVTAADRANENSSAKS